MRCFFRTIYSGILCALNGKVHKVGLCINALLAGSGNRQIASVALHHPCFHVIGKLNVKILQNLFFTVSL